MRINQLDNLKFIKIKNITFSNLYYTDIFLLVGIGIIVLYIRNFFKDFKPYDHLKAIIGRFLFIEQESINSIYKEDLPISGNKTIDNEKIINKLLPKIIQLNPLNAFIIGINAEWGHGKTSFLKRLEYRLKYDLKFKNHIPITFWFNAWQHQDEKSIINNFFNQLKKELSRYSGDAKTSINQYLSKLFAIIDKSNGIKFLNNDILSTDSSIEDYYANIQNLINRIDKKIIVFVDDLDRLNKNEISEVIRILRNVANFKNTVFVCGFDKNYVIKEGGFDHNYLNKIFNLEINLPKLPQNGLWIYLKDLIEKSSVLRKNEAIIKEFNKIFEYDTEDHPWMDISLDNLLINNKELDENDLNSIPLTPLLFFDTRRDIKRFYNSLITNIDTLEKIDDVELRDYLVFKLLIFKYYWLIDSFKGKLLNFWLGDQSTLKLQKNKLYFFENRKDIQNIDKITIFSVLEYLFYDNEQNLNQEGSKRMNQRRYLPLYLNNNIYNQSFSYSDLLTAHKEHNISSLIDSRVLNESNKNSLLNDIKSYILREDNLKNIQDFDQAITVIKKYLSIQISHTELLHLLHFGESIDGFKELSNTKIFIQIDDVFGNFLGQLNEFYSTGIKNISYPNDFFGSYFNKNDIEGLDILNRSYVKEKTIKLFQKFANKERSIQEISNKLYDCAEYHCKPFYLRLYYDEISNIYKEYLKNNFFEFFIKLEPLEIVRFFDVKSLASLFVTKKDKEDIIQQAKELIKNKTQWTETDLNDNPFLRNGWINFLSYIENISKNIDLTESEIEKKNYLIHYIREYIKNGFIIPNKSI
ncbi:hypothetical protein GCM10022393_27640 [Aquimarina addita]|uniref:KAP NTPase domain-containing protein n=1 Tax=Aquimarina addita TaxID=870485 RepID=A0ABP6ULZ6_9FLAO